jgi:molecular chaperone DnaK
VTKGTPLPATGSKEFKAAFGIGTALPGHLDLELFQDEGADDPDLNLNIGAFRVSHHDLPDGMVIKEGDPIIFHWSMNESGLLTASVELPSVRQTFSTKRFYVDQAGHKSFDGEGGEKLVEATIAAAETDTAEIVDAVGPSAQADLKLIERDLEEQRRKLREASTGDERRSITENVRHIRQEAARVRAKPENRGRVLAYRLVDRIKTYNELARPAEPMPDSQRFDQQAEAASNELKRKTTASFDMAESIIEQMDGTYWRTLWRKADFVAYMFDLVSKQRHLAADKSVFDLLLADGQNALAANDVDELRLVVVRIIDNQIAAAAASSDITKLAAVLRG